MNIIVKQGFKYLWTHILSIALTFFLLLAFGWIIQKWGMYYFSIFTSIFYVSLIYSDAWTFGRLEGKLYNEVKETPLRALVASLIPSTIGILFLLFIILNYNTPIISFIAKVWYVAFLGYFKPEENITIFELLSVIAVFPITSFIAYFAGMKNFSILDKLNFKRKAKKK